MIITISKKEDGCMGSEDNFNKFLEKKKITKKTAKAGLVHGKEIKIIGERFSQDDLKEVDVTKITEEVDDTNLTGELACGSGGCELK